MKVTTIFTLALGLVLVGITAVFAATALAKGTGTLVASGDGMARVMLRQGQAEVNGKGDLMVSKEANVVITGTQGTREEKQLKDGKATMVTYKGFDGKAVITGEKCAFGIKGTGLKLTVTGAGHAILVGTGDYTVTQEGTDDKTTGQWAAKPKKGDTQDAVKAARTPITFGVVEHQGGKKAKAAQR